MADRKETNPKDALGVKRAPISTVPMNVVLELGSAMLEGARKYGRHNFRAAGVRHSIYIDAAFRHLAAHWEGEDIDPDSGLPHITKAMAALAVLRDSQYGGNDQDDRPPSWGVSPVMGANAQAENVIARTPDPAMPHTEQEQEFAMDVETLLEATHELPREAFPKQGTTGRDVFHSVAGDQEAAPEDLRNAKIGG